MMAGRPWHRRSANLAVDTEFARNHLALIIVELAKDGQLSPLQMTRTSARLMRDAYKT
jgi:hypothetical protein